MKMPQTGLHYSGKIRYFVENLIFPTDTPNGGKLSLEKGYFMKIYNISMKRTERDSITVKNLVFCMIFLENLIFQ